MHSRTCMYQPPIAAESPQPETILCKGAAQPHIITPSDFAGESNRYVCNSGYQEEDHQTDLWSMHWQEACMTLALKTFTNISDDYAKIPYQDAFNIGDVIDQLKSIVGDKIDSFEERKYFIVAFRSKLKDLTVYTDLSPLDKAAHAEATRLGILKYWYGSPDSERRNLATCFWACRLSAAKAARCPDHIKAVKLGTPMYEWFKIECFELTVSQGISDWTFKPIEIRGHSKH